MAFRHPQAGRPKVASQRTRTRAIKDARGSLSGETPVLYDGGGAGNIVIESA